MNRYRGFTLLELVIALALISLILLLLFSAFRFSSKVWESVENRVERDSEMRLIYHYLADRVEQARSVKVHLERAGREVFFFSGHARGVEFVSPMPAHLGSGGLYIIRLQTRESGEDNQLLLSRWLFHPEVLEGARGLPPWEPLQGGDIRVVRKSPNCVPTTVRLCW